MTTEHQLGAHVIEGGVRFGVWASNAQVVEVELLGKQLDPLYHQLERSADGVHVGVASGAGAGNLYRYRLDETDSFPDPRSRFQPEGVHGPSMVVDPTQFAWTDDGWSGVPMERLAVYELHVGTYTPEGTFVALREQLEEIKRLGVTAIEIMPVADFPGRWNWGYDGVALFAPSRAYGTPDDLRKLVDTAHQIDLGVVFDVVYNHLGPDGNYLMKYSNDYFTDRHMTPWGDAINYDGENARFVRDFAIENAISWITEYHADGLRLDATDTILDESDVHLLRELQRRVRAATDRTVVIIAEEARNSVRTVRPVSKGGYGIDAVWADEFHHELRVYLTNARENYYANYEGTLAGVATAIEEGFVYQGQVQPASGKSRGTKVTDEPATAFMFCIQNHDQVGNRPFGERLHHDVNGDRYAVASTTLLFAPEPPLIFMGQEFAASTPFLFFTDHNEELGRLVTEGRRKEFGGFRAFADEGHRSAIPDPQAESTFLSSRLKLDERELNAGIYALYRGLLAMRWSDPVLSDPSRERTQAAELGLHTLVVRRWKGNEERLLIANFDSQATVELGNREVLKDIQGGRWEQRLSTAEPRFGGSGREAIIDQDVNPTRLTVPARTAVIWAVSRD